MVHPRSVVVVGGGIASLELLRSLRAQGFAGALTLVSGERRLPYDRPPLSKQVLRGELDDTTLEGLPSDVELHLGRRATGLEPGLVRTDAGDLEADAVVVATGAAPVALPGDAAVLRTADDALWLRDQLVPGARVLVVGAGWVGAEVAGVATERGCAVTVLEAAAAPLVVALGTEVGAATAPWYADRGVSLRTGCRVRHAGRRHAELDSGEVIEADVVVTGIGVRPDVAWLEGSAVAVEAGVLVDEHGCSSVAGVFAVGDCAARWSPRYQARVRGEHWDDALRAPAAVASTVLGAPTAYDPVPYFWSEQLGRTLQYVGHRRGAERVVWRGSADDPSGWGAGWLDDDERLVAFACADRPRDLVQARKAIEAGAALRVERFADPECAVRDSVGSTT